MKKYILITFLSFITNVSALHASAYLDWDKAKQIVDAAKLPHNLVKLYNNDLLMIAAENGSLIGIKLSLQAGADINAANNDGNTALMFAAASGSKEAVKLLLEKGADIHAVDNYGQNAFIFATTSGSKSVLELFLEKGLDVNAVNNDDGDTPLMKAAILGSKEGVKLLLEKGADIHAVDNYGYNAFMFAAISGSKEVLELFLERGINVNAVYDDGNTALMKVAGLGSKEGVKLLLDKGADIHAVNHSGITAFIYAIMSGSKDVLELFLEKGINVNAVYFDGNTALMYAAISGSKEVIELLLNADADVNTVNNNGATALIFAARSGYKEIMELLLEKGANVNAVDSFDPVVVISGKTALMCAVTLKSKEMTELLLKAGADVNFVNENGESAMSLADDSIEIKQMLLRYKIFKFIKIDKNFDREPEPEDYYASNEELTEVSDDDLEGALYQADNVIAAFEEDHFAYWHDRLQRVYEKFVFQNDSAPLRRLLIQELSKRTLLIRVFMNCFNSREDFLYVLNQLKHGATEQELITLQEIIKAEKTMNKELIAVEAEMNERYRYIAERLKKDDAARKIQNAFRKNKQRQLNR